MISRGRPDHKNHLSVDPQLLRSLARYNNRCHRASRFFQTQTATILTSRLRVWKEADEADFIRLHKRCGCPTVNHKTFTKIVSLSLFRWVKAKEKFSASTE